MDLKKLIHPKPVLRPPASGLYPYRERTQAGEARLHLRIDPDGSGMLMVNASRVYHFNPTAAFMAFLVLEKAETKQAIKSIVRAYQVGQAQAAADYTNLAAQIRLMVMPGYEQLATLMRDFSSLSAKDIQTLRAAAPTINQMEFTHLAATIEPGDEDGLIALIPVIAGLKPATRANWIEQLNDSGSNVLCRLVQGVEQLDDTALAALQEIARTQPGMEYSEPVFDTILPFSRTDLRAPYRMDLALTYRCNNSCHHCYNPAQRKREELDTTAWKAIIDELWKIGVPHIIFTGGEPTIRPDLPELIAHAEANGQITGINTNGRRLKDPQYVQQLVDAGLDHVQITLESHDAHIHDQMVGQTGAWAETVAGIRAALDTRLYLMTNTTLLTNNYQALQETLQFLADIGVKRVGLNALIYSGQGEGVGTGLREEMLPDLLLLAREMVIRNNQKLTWYTPTQYCHFDPVLFDFQTLGVKGCTAALYNMCVEPDGKVLPCQSYYQPIGEMLKQPWETIWNHELALSLRKRTERRRRMQRLQPVDGVWGRLPAGCPGGKN